MINLRIPSDPLVKKGKGKNIKFSLLREGIECKTHCLSLYINDKDNDLKKCF
jgi:hypothetical protein